MIRDDIHRLANIIWEYEYLVVLIGEAIQRTKSEHYDLLRRTPEEIGETYLGLFKPLGVVSPYADPEPAQGLAESQREFFRSVGVSPKGKKSGKKSLPVQLAWLFFNHAGEAENFYKRAIAALRENGAQDKAAAFEAHSIRVSKASGEALERESLVAFDRLPNNHAAAGRRTSSAPQAPNAETTFSFYRDILSRVGVLQIQKRAYLAVPFAIVILGLALWGYLEIGGSSARPTSLVESTTQSWSPVAVAPSQLARSDAGPIRDIDIDEAELSDQSASVGSLNFLELEGVETLRVSLPDNPIVGIEGHASGLAQLSSRGRPVRIMRLGNLYAGFADRDVVFTFDLTDPADFEFRLHRPLDHAESANVVVEFPFVITRNGRANPTPRLARIHVLDDAPSLSATYCNFPENSMFGNNSAGISGQLQRALHEAFSFGADGPGHVRFSGGYHVSRADPYEFGEDYHSATSALAVAPTSNGIPVEIEIIENSVSGTANGRVVFSIFMNQHDGTYRYEQFEPLDHHVNGIGEVLYLSFSVDVFDSDGDRASAHLDFNVYDQTQHEVAQMTNSVRQ